ncbi:D-alanyl-D-alanine carboxypeptidase family protein [Desulfotomaculum sp. 1211_IL3151]|uniref:D-alanyl-D-alanine carboxypeptidase family protein n=1 Tax=Desulfotomaculum sp. 1211_IL3151 TaxID=3084055 RepID=UPI002FDA20C6
MRKICCCILLVMLLILPFNTMALAGEPQIVGETAVLLDAKSGTVLYGKEEHKKMYPASTTKVLTALLALERSQLTKQVTIGPNPSKAGGTSIWLQEGEQLTLEELLHALMLNSANDAGVAIAEHIAGSVDKFAELSNERAKQIGAKGTHFTNPHGMPGKEHYSTAYDLALIGREALKNQDLRKIITTINYEIPRADPEAQKHLFNHNKLLWSKTYGYKGATGLKTGYTVDAGQCIIASAERDGMELIAVVLRSEGFNIWTDASKLLDYGFENFTSRQLVKGGQVMADVPVQYGKGSVKLLTKNDLYYTFPKEGNIDLHVTTEPDEEVSAPVTKGEVLGAVIIRKGEEIVGKVPLVAHAAVQRDWKMTLTTWFKWGLPLLLFFLWLRRRIYLRRKRQQRLARRRKYYNYPELK